MPKAGKNKSLSTKEAAFCRYFLVLNDAKQAAIKAGYSERGAKQAGHKLLQRPNVQLELTRLRQVSQAAVDQMVTAANSGERAAVPAQIRQMVAPTVEAILKRAYANLALIEAVEIGLGRRKMKASRAVVIRDPDTGRFRVEHVDEEGYQVNLNAAVRAAELLHRELGRQEGASGDFEDDNADRGLGAAIEAFRAATRGTGRIRYPICDCGRRQ